MNSINVIGRLTKDPELRMTQSEKSVVSFTIACDSGWGDKKTASFFPCVAWGKTAEFIDKYFRKGDPIAISGELRSRQYEGKDGKRTVIEILVNGVDFCGGKKSEAEHRAPSADSFENEWRKHPSGFTDVLEPDEGLPF